MSVFAETFGNSHLQVRRMRLFRGSRSMGDILGTDFKRDITAHAYVLGGRLTHFHFIGLRERLLLAGMRTQQLHRKFELIGSFLNYFLLYFPGIRTSYRRSPWRSSLSSRRPFLPIIPINQFGCLDSLEDLAIIKLRGLNKDKGILTHTSAKAVSSPSFRHVGISKVIKGNVRSGHSSHECFGGALVIVLRAIAGVLAVVGKIYIIGQWCIRTLSFRT